MILSKTKDITKQCKYCHHEVVEGSEYCQRHGSNSSQELQARETLYNLQKTKFLSTVERFTNNPQRFTLTTELGVLRAILEDYLNRMDDPRSIDRYATQVNTQIILIEKVIDKALKLDTRIKELLSREELQIILQEIVDIIAEEIGNADTISTIVERFNEVLGKDHYFGEADG